MIFNVPGACVTERFGEKLDALHVIKYSIIYYYTKISTSVCHF